MFWLLVIIIVILLFGAEGFAELAGCLIGLVFWGGIGAGVIWLIIAGLPT